MSIDEPNEKKFESDIESYFISPSGGYTKGSDVYDAKRGLFVNTLISFIQATQPKAWERFARRIGSTATGSGITARIRTRASIWFSS